MLLALAWRNLWRRPQRTLLSLVSIVIVSGLLVFMLSYQTGVYAAMKQGTLRIFDGYAELQPQGYAADPAIDRTIDHPDRLIRAAEARAGILAAPRVNGFAILANGARSYGAAVIGVDPAREAAVSSIPRAIRKGRYLAPSDTGAAVVGAALARNLGLSVGGKLTLIGSARDGSVAADVLEIVGIYESGVPELDRTILEMPLKRAQTTFDMGDRVNTIALGGPSLSQVNAALPALGALAGYEHAAILDWTRLEPGMYDALVLKWATSLLFYLTLVVVVAFIILNALLMSVLERVREFAVLLAVGMRPRLIAGAVWLELVLLAGLGCAIGFATGAAVTLWLARRGIAYPESMASLLAQYGLPTRLYPALSVFSGSTGPGAILLAILLGGFVPYLRVLRLVPAAAMRAP